MSSAGAAELYVYYRLDPLQAQAAQQAFDRARAGAPVRLLQRRDLAAGTLTWMEIYAAAATGLEPAIANTMLKYCEGPRHREWFAPLA